MVPKCLCRVLIMDDNVCWRTCVAGWTKGLREVSCWLMETENVQEGGRKGWRFLTRRSFSSGLASRIHRASL